MKLLRGPFFSIIDGVFRALLIYSFLLSGMIIPPAAVQAASPSANSGAGARAATVVVTNSVTSGATHRFLIYPGTNEAETVTQLQQQGVTKIEKYGSYWLGTGPAAQPQLQSAKRARSAPQIETVDHFNKIELGAASFDVTAGEPALPAHLKQAANQNKNLQIVQFKGPVLPDWLAQLKAIPGVRIIRYIPNNAYLVQVASAARQAVQNLATTNGPVQWIGAYHPYYKIQGDLLAAAGVVEINVGILDGAEAEATLTTLERHALRGMTQRQSATRQWVAQLKVNASDLTAISQLPSVLWVQRYHPVQHLDEMQGLVLANDTGGVNGYPVPLQTYENFLLGLGFSTTATEYPVLDICDTGIDKLSPYCTPPCANYSYPFPYITWHPAFSYPTLSVSPDETTCNYPLGVQFRKVYDFSGADDIEGHGTIVASVACGYDNLPDEPFINCITQGYITNSVNTEVIVIVTNGFTVGFESCVGFAPPPCCSTPNGCTNWNLSVVKVTNVVITVSCTTNDASKSAFPPPPWYLSRQDFSGYQLGMGVSPFGRFGASNYKTASQGAAFGEPEGVVLQNYLNGGARISNNSWHEILSVGSNDGHYDSLSQSYDRLTRDAVNTGTNATPGHLPMNQEILFVFAGGNDNGVDAVGGYGDVLITPPATAKNVISVGATDLRAGSGNTFHISTFSSFGPTQDGRFKPDVVAPGEGISGAISQASYVHTDCGACDPNAPNPYACDPGFTTKPALQRLYCTLDSAVADYSDFSGTSFAAPAVAGGAQLLWWWFQNKLPSNGQYVNPVLAYMLPPSPAMMKAYILNSARYLPITNPLTGTQDKLPSIAQGMGMMDLSNMFNSASRILRDESTPRAIDVPLYYTNAVIQQTYFSAPGQSYEVTGTVASASEPFRVTLAWTDAPGDPLVLKQLVNDLDLQVTINNQAVYAGNDFNTQYAAVNPNPKYDKLNNVESVFLPAGLPAGTPWSILIRAVNIAGNGVLNVGSANDQDFALVIYNARTGTSDTVPPVATNNTCQVALSITNFPFTWTNNLTAANYANIQPSPTAGRGGIDEFFKLAHPSPGTQFNVDTLGSSFDTVVSVWRGSCGALVEENSNNDASNSFQSATSFTANGVDDYYIVAEPHNNGPGGQLVLHVVTSVSPVILTPGSINFPDTISGITSTPQTVTLQNGLTVLLNVLRTTITGANSNEFVILSSTCAGSTVTSNGTCTISVAFAPTSTVAVARSAQLVIYDDATGSPRFVNLTGNALAPAALVQLTPNVVSFGTQAVSVASAPQTVTVKNIGTANLLLSNAVIRLDPANFAIASTTCGGYPATLTPGASCSYNVTFTPGAGGPTNAILSITNSTGVAEANLLGTGCPVITIPTILPPAAAGAPYNQVLVASGGTPSYTYAVTVGTLPAGLTLSGSGVLSGTPSNLVSQTFTVTATDIYGCSGTQTYTLTVGCSTPNLHPGTLPAGLQFSPYSVTFTASGGIAPYNYAVTAGGLPPGLTLALTGQLTGSPTTTNVIPFSVTVTDSNGCASVPITYSLSVALATPLLSESPAMINFTDQLVGTTGPVQQVTVSNPGNGPLTITDIGFTGGDAGDFLLANTTCLGSAIPAGGNCFINISSAPTNSGLLNATLRILSNAGNQNPATNDIPVHGSGVAPTMGVAPSSIDFGTNRVGFTSIPRSVTVTNTGNGPLTISSVAITGVNPADFNIVANLCSSGQILPGQSCRIQLTFLTAASLPRSALLTITGNATNSPQSVALSGVGMNIVCPAITINTNLAGLAASIFNSQTLQANGGVAPYSFAVTDGALPAGMALSASGVLAGIPKANGTNVFTVQASDAFHCPGSQVYTQIVSCSTLSIAPATLPTATNGVGYSQTLLVDTNNQLVGGSTRFDNNLPVAFSGTGESSLVVTNIGNSISNVTVSLYFEYFATFNGSDAHNLPAVSMIGPDGTTVNLVNIGSRYFTSGTRTTNDTTYGSACDTASRLTFADSAAAIIPGTLIGAGTATILPVVGTYRPDQPLATFTDKSGAAVNGTWQLLVQGDTGVSARLDCWSLAFSMPVQFNFAVQDTTNLPPGVSLSGAGVFSGTPTKPGTYTFNVLVSDPTGCQNVQPYTITVANGVPAIGYAPPLLPTFGDVVIGATGSVQTITLSSLGNVNLTITNIAMVGANPLDFTVDTSLCLGVPLPPASTCPLHVNFTPTTSGNRSALVAVYSTDPVNNPIYLQLKGAGIAPMISAVPTNINFGTQAVNVQSAPQWVQVYNTGDGPLTITGLTLISTNAPDFTILTNSCLGSAIQPGDSCSIGLTFKPSAALSRTGTLVIDSNGTNGQQRIHLSGVGANTAPSLGVAPLSLIFGDTTVGTTSIVQSLTVTNGGTAALVIGSLSFTNLTTGATNGFVVLNSTCLGASIAPSNSCTIFVGFYPTASGLTNSNLRIVSNSGSGTNMVPVIGFGVAPSLALSATSLDFGTNVVGVTSSAQTITITNTGNAALVISSVTTGGANPRDFNILADPCLNTPILPGNLCQISLNFMTTVALARSAVLTIVDNAANSPQTVALSGAGKQVTCPAITVLPAVLPPASSSVTYSQVVTATGGVAPYNFQIISGALPLNLSLSSTGLLTGTLVQTGTFAFVIQATDANGCGGSQAYSLTAGCSSLTLLPAPVDLSPAINTVPYFQQLTLKLPSGQVAGGYQTFTNNQPTVIPAQSGRNADGTYNGYTVDSLLPVAGVGAVITNVAVSFAFNYDDAWRDLTVSLVSPGGTVFKLYDLPPTAPPASLQPVVQDFGVACAPQSQRLTFVDSGPATIVPSRQPLYVGVYRPLTSLAALDGTSGAAVNGTWKLRIYDYGYVDLASELSCWSLSFGTISCASFAVTAGTLPPGIVLTSDGALSGTPTNTGLYSFTVTATDCAGCGTSQAYSMTVGAGTPALSFDPPVLPAFSSVIVGATGTVQTVTIWNSGTSPLVVSNLVLAGANPADFFLSSTCAGTTIPIGGSCNVAVYFTPTASSNRSANIVVTNNAAGSPVLYPINGAGFAPVMAVAPTSLNCGTQTVNVATAPQWVRVTNGGDGPLTVIDALVVGSNSTDFAVTAKGCVGIPLQPGDSCEFGITFTPGLAQSRTATLVIDSNGTNGVPRGQQLVTLTGMGATTAPSLGYTPASLLFGDTVVGTTNAVTQSVIVTNGGSAALVLTNISASSGDFVVTAGNGCLNKLIAPGAVAPCTITVAFSPTATGSRNGFINLYWNNGSTTPAQVPLSGTGLASVPVLLFNPGLLPTFGDVVLGTTSAVQVVTVTNAGTASLVISNVTLAGNNPGEFILDPPNTCLGVSVLPGGTCKINVKFTPTVAFGSGNRGAIVVVTNNAGIPQSFPVKGAGIAPVLLTVPAAMPGSGVDFGTQPVGITSTPSWVQIYNTGNGPLTVNSATIISTNAPDFAIVTNTCLSSPIQPGGSCSIGITFRPGATLLRTGTLVIDSNGTNGEQRVALHGTGANLAPALLPLPSTVNFGDMIVCASSLVQPVVVTNFGTAVLIITNIDLDYTGYPTSTGQFGFAQFGCVGSLIQTGAGCTVNVTFTPTNSGAKGANLRLWWNNAGAPTTVPVIGNAIAPAVTNDGPHCSGDTLTFTAPTVAGATYAWTGPHGFSSALQNPVILNAQTNASGTYTLQINVGGCPSVPATTVATISQRPTATLTGSIAIGPQDSVILTNALTGQGPWTVTYSDGTVHPYVGGAGITGFDYYTVAVTNTTSYTVTALTDSSPAACPARPIDLNGTATVTVYPRPTAAVFLDAGLIAGGGNDYVENICVGAATNIFATLTGTGPWTVTWQDGVGGTNFVQGPVVSSPVRRIVSPGATTVYTISALTDAHIAAQYLKGDLTGSGTLIINPYPSANLTFSPVGYVQISSTGTVSVPLPPGGPATYKWHFDNATIISDPNTNSIQFLAGSSGNVTAKVAVVSAVGCGSTNGIGWVLIMNEPLVPAVSNLAFRAYAVDEHNPPVMDFTTQSEPLAVKFVNDSGGPVSIIGSNFFDKFGASMLGSNGGWNGAGDYSINRIDYPFGSPIPAGKYCTVWVQFHPTTTYPDRNGTLVLVTDNSLIVTATVAVTGLGKYPSALANLPPGTEGYAMSTIGDVPLGFWNDGSVLLTNVGNFGVGEPQEIVIGGGAQASYTSVYITDDSSGGAFWILPGTCPSDWTAPFPVGDGNWVVGQGTPRGLGQMCPVDIGFSPPSGLSTGKYYATVHVTGDFMTTNDSHEITYMVKAQATAPILTVIEPTPPSALQFPPTTVNFTSGPQRVVVQNTGDGILKNIQFQIISTNAEDFTILTDSCGSLQPGDICGVTIGFRPGSIGSRTGTLLVRGDATNTPPGSVPQVPPTYLAVPLHGTGAFGLPSIGVNPGSLNFGNVAQYNVSPPQTITVTNGGQLSLVISTNLVFGSGNGTNDFTVVGTSCLGTPIVPGGACQIQVVFNPTNAASTGPRSTWLQIRSNSGTNLAFVSENATNFVLLTGYSTLPILSVNPTNINFGNQPIGLVSPPMTVTVQNSGTAPMTLTNASLSGPAATDFTVSDVTSCGSIPPNGSCALTMTFLPGTNGTRAATLHIAGLGVSADIPVNGTGVTAAPSIAFVPALLPTFGNVVVGTTSVVQSVTVTNGGTAALVINGVTLGGLGGNTNDFLLDPASTCGSVVPGGTCTINVKFTPTASGNRGALVIVSDNATNSPHSFPVKGAGIAPVIATVPTSPPGVNFGLQTVSVASAPQWVQVSNTGDGPLTITGLTLISTNAPDFTIVSSNCFGSIIQPGDSCSIGISFTPGAALLRTATLVIDSTATNGQQRIHLSGSGAISAPSLAVTPTSLIFGDTILGTTSTVQSVTVTNGGTAALVISGVAFTNGTDFIVLSTNCVGAAILPGGQCTLQVAMAPHAPGARYDVLRIRSNSGTGTNDVLVSGSGLGPVISLSATALEFGTNYQGTAGNQLTLTITNSGNAALTVSNVTMSGLNPGDFTILSDLCLGSPILAGKSCQISILFSTTTLLDRSAQLIITGNAINSPRLVALHGTGAIYPCQTIGLSPTTLPVANTRVPYSQTITPVNGTGPFTFTSSGNIPIGLTLFPNGALAGTPAQLGTNVFTVNVTDAHGCVGSQTYTIGVACAQLQLLPATLPSSTEGQSYAQQLQVTTTGGQILSTTTRFDDPVYTVIPSGATMDITNVVAGLVGVASSVRVSLYLSNPDLANQSEWPYDRGLEIWLIAPDGTQVQLIQAHTATDPSNTFSGWPLGADLGNGCSTTTNEVFFDSSSTNNIYYTASPHIGVFAPDQSLYALKGKNANGIWRLRVRSNFNASVLNCWTLWIDGSTYTFGISNGALPNGISLDSNSGLLSGTPAGTGTNTFTITATDASGGCTASNRYSLYVAPNPFNPGISFDPPLLSTFADVPIGTVSTSQTVIVNNSGSAALSITNLALAGTDASQFILDPPSSCITAIQPGSSCAINIRFAPTSSGNKGAIVLVYDNATNNPHSFPIKGAGIAPVISALPPSLNFGTQTVNVVSAPQWVQVYNTGNGPLTVTGVSFISTNAPDFAITDDTCLGSPIQPGSSCSIGVSFKPGAVLARTATLVIDSNGTNGQQRVPLKGVGANTGAALGVNPTNLIFGDTTLGSTNTALLGTTNGVASVTVTNGGTAALVISSVGFAGGNSNEFVILNSTCVGAGILPGNSCTIQVAFAPTGSAARVSNLQLISNSGTGTNLVRVSGSGVGPFISLSANALDFGTNIVGAVSPVQSVVVSNRGNGLLIINNLILGGLNPGDFSIISSNCVGAGILPGKSCHIDMTFQTSEALPRSATLTVVGNELNAPIVINLTGTGKQFVCPTITVGPATLPNAYSKVNYNQNLTGSGSGGLYTYNLSQGQLPDGITLSAAGVLTGLPRMIGTNTFTITATDANGCSGSRAYTLAVTCPTLTILPSSVAQATMGTAYNQSLSVRLPDGTAVSSTLRFDNLTSINISDAVTQNIGGVYYYYFNAGSQLTFTSTVAVAGVDAAITNLTVSMYLNYHDNSQSPAGSRTGIGELTVKLIGPDSTTVTLSGGNGGSGNNFGVACAPDSSHTVFSDAATTAIADPNNASPYTGTFRPDVPLNAFVGKTGSAVNGLWTLEVDVAPSFYRADSGTLFCWGLSIAGPQITYAVTGSLPPGLTLTVGGLLSGTPTASGSYTSIVTVTDASGCTGSQPLIFNVAPAAPIIEFVPNPLPTFGDVVVGTTSAVQSVTVTNLGNAPLVITNLVLAGANTNDNTNDFRLTPVSPCLSQLLAPGEACQINVRFAPTTVGNRSTTVLVFDNATNSPHSFQVTGTGISPAILPVPASLDFGTQTVAMTTAPLLIDVFNTGNGPLTITGLSLVGTNSPDFTIVTNSCLGTPLQPGSSCSVGIQFTPGATFTRTGTLVIDSNATNGQQRIALRGLGIIPAGAAIAVATPTAVDFGSQLIGSNSQPKVVYVSNVGNTALTINDVQIGGLNTGDFSILSNSCGALLPGQICQIQLQFNPQVAIPRRALLLINSTATNGQQQVVLTGLGLAAKPVLCLSTTVVDFGIQTNAMAGSSRTIQVTNCGTGELAIIDLILTDPNFVISNTTCVGSAGNILETGQSCTINLEFLPIGNGPHSGLLQIPTDIGTTNITLKGASVYTCGTLYFPDLTNVMIAGESYSEKLVFSSSLSASNPPVTTQFTLVDGLLPDGLTLSTDGGITGIPTQPGSNQFTIAAMDSNGCGTNRLFNLNVACGQLTIASTLPASVPATAGLAYSNKFAAIIGNIPLNTTYTFAQNRSMPVPHAYYGTNGFVTAITNSLIAVEGIQGDLAKVTVSVHYVNPDSVDNASLSLIGPDGTTVELTYAHDFWPYHTSYGVGCDPSSIATFDGAAPNSITDYWNYYGYYGYYGYYDYGYYDYNLEKTYTGAFRPTSSLTNFIGKTGSALNGNWQLQINNADYWSAGALTCWSLQLSAAARITYSAKGLPSDLGLTLSSSGLLSGTPNKATNVTIAITATSAGSNCSGSTNFVLKVVCPTITVQPISVALAPLNSLYTTTITATNGTAPYTFTSSSLPPGFSLDQNTGVISGTATNTGTYTFTVTATDANGCQGSSTSTLTLACGSGVLLPASIVNSPVVGQTYTQIFSVANGGTGSNTYLLAAGSLPPGLTLTNAANGNCALLGTATRVGNYSFQLMVLTPGGCLIQRTYSLAVVCAASGIGPDQLPLGQLGVAYPATQLTTLGGAGSSTFTVIDGSVPAGLTVSSTGILQGTPASGSSVFTVLASDGVCSVTKSYTIIIALGPQVMVLGPDTLTDASTGQTVAQSLTASGGTGPVLFAVTAGALPDGVTLSNAGQLQGAPTVPGTNTFTISASDATGMTGSRQYRLVVRPAANSNLSNDIGVSIQSAAAGTAGSDLTYAITVTNLGSAAATAVTVRNLLPVGATFGSASAGTVADGVLTANLGTLAPNAGATVAVVVTPTVVGNLDLVANVSATEADANPANNSADVTVPVAAAPALDTVQFSAASYVVTRTGGAARITVTRTGPAIAAATIGYTTRDGSGQAGIDYAAGSGLLIFGPGVTEQSFTVAVLPVKGAKVADKTVLLSLTSLTGVRLGSVPSATLTITSKLVVTDSDGDQVTVKLTGHGSVALTLAAVGRGPIQQIVLTGTDARSQLLVTVKKAGGNGYAEVGSIVADGSLQAINAPTVNLVGAGVSVNGCLGALTIHNLLNGAAVTANCAANQTTKITLHAKDTGTTIATGGHVAYKLMK